MVPNCAKLILSYCSRDIKVGNMVESDLKSHILSKWHEEKTPSLSNIASLLTLHHQDQSDKKGKDSNELASKETTSNESAKTKQSSVDQLFVKSEKKTVISAEIRWVNSSLNSGDLFSVIFSDSDIAKWFQCEHTRLVLLPISLFSRTDVVKIIRLSLYFFIFWRIFKQFSSERSNGCHSILGLGEKLYCRTLPRIGIYG